jgi:ribosomal protein L37E
MTITNCPRCGSMNITTAGVCANCGWSQFAQVTTVSTRITGETELKVSGKALLDDYKRLLLENRNLKERIAELEAKAEAQESEATSCKFCGSNKSDVRMNSIVCTSCGRKIGNIAPPEVQQ